MLRVIGLTLLSSFGAGNVAGQSANPVPLSFEVASVKLHDGTTNVMCGFSSSGPRATWVACSAFALIREAYNVKSYQLQFDASVQRPAEGTYYDIVTKAEGDSPRTRSEFQQMLQGLLAKRFNLRSHRRMQEMPVYGLIVDKNGPKLRKSAPDAAFHSRGGVIGHNQYFEATKASMEILIDSIWNYTSVDRPIVDRTGLAGTYDFRIESTIGSRMGPSPELSDIDIFTAVRDQLGLRLERQTAEIEVLIVDRWEGPTAN